MSIELSNENYQLFAAKHYNNPACTDIRDFYDDLNRIKYVKRLLRRYDSTNDLQERRLLNHITILYNMFDAAAIDLLLFKIEKKFWCILKTCFIYLNMITENDSRLSLVVPNTIVAAKLQLL